MAAALPVVLVTTCLGVFLAQLDTSVVNLALKHVGAELGSSITQLQWIVDGYNLAYGVLADRRNARRHLRPPPLVHDRRRSFYGWIADLRDRSRQCDNDRRPDADRTWRRIRDADIARDFVRCLSGSSSASAPSASGRAAMVSRGSLDRLWAASSSIISAGDGFFFSRFRLGCWRACFAWAAFRSRAAKTAAASTCRAKYSLCRCWERCRLPSLRVLIGGGTTSLRSAAWQPPYARLLASSSWKYARSIPCCR